MFSFLWDIFRRMVTTMESCILNLHITNLARHEVLLKWIINTLKRCQLIVIVLESLLLTLKILYTLLFSVSIPDMGAGCKNKDILYTKIYSCLAQIFVFTLQVIGIQHSVYNSFSQFRDSYISTYFHFVLFVAWCYIEKLETKVNCNLFSSILILMKKISGCFKMELHLQGLLIF